LTVKPYLFIGDAQENLQAVHYALALREQYHVVFLGDILDSWSFATTAHLAVLQNVLDAVDAGAATLIAANHEWSYLDPAMRCSGWRPDIEAGLRANSKALEKRLLAAMSSHLWLPKEKVLVTHAGLTKQVWDQQELAVEDVSADIDNAYRLGVQSWYFGIGRTRGGWARAGGPLWCDWIMEFTPVPGIRQVVGHTNRLDVPMNFKETMDGPMRLSDNGDWCIDCLNREPAGLVLDNGQFSVRSLA
jgi:hypothetical protein